MSSITGKSRLWAILIKCNTHQVQYSSSASANLCQETWANSGPKIVAKVRSSIMICTLPKTKANPDQETWANPVKKMAGKSLTIKTLGQILIKKHGKIPDLPRSDWWKNKHCVRFDLMVFLKSGEFEKCPFCVNVFKWDSFAKIFIVVQPIFRAPKSKNLFCLNHLSVWCFGLWKNNF